MTAPDFELCRLLRSAFGYIDADQVVAVRHEVKRNDTGETLAVCDCLATANAIAAALNHVLQDVALGELLSESRGAADDPR